MTNQLAPRHAPGARLEVDPAAVAANTRAIARRVGGDLIAVVKADGYGHGAVTVARAALAHGASSLGVTSIAEGLELRRAGVDAPVLSWLNPVEADFATAVRVGIDLAVPSLDHLAAIVAASTAAACGPARLHLHLDTGLARDGADVRSWVALCRAAWMAERAGQVRVVGVMGHLPCADQPGHPANTRGRAVFLRGVAAARRVGLRPVTCHLAATSAALTDPRSHHDAVRAGAGLVGIDPSGRAPRGLLRGALTVTAPVVVTREVRAGTSVGYDHTWTAPRATRLVLLPLGYADGLPRAAAPGAEVLLRGRRCRVVGRISMDQVVVDVGDAPVGAGERALVMGPGDAGEPTVADWAGWSGLLPHEIVTGLGPRLERVVMSTAQEVAA